MKVGLNPQRKWMSILTSALVSWILILLTIFGFGAYGIAMFVFIPLFIGFAPTLIYGNRDEMTKRKSRQLAWLNAGIVSLGLLIFALEGIICLAMASPIVLLFCTIGSNYAYNVVSKKKVHTSSIFVIALLIIPGMGFIDTKMPHNTHKVVTSIDIKASPQEIWDVVVAFPPLAEPEELMFKTGISYPTKAAIRGSGVGAVRYCTFNTGDFVEPITLWDEPKLLAFDVEAQPVPMTELSFWKVDAPHLHDYFTSESGQFKLIELENGFTRLEGTTWYHHRIKPVVYWQLWSDKIIHTIHLRVLRHVKAVAEAK